MWCDKHDHVKRSCPWCQIEEYERILDELHNNASAWEQKADQLAKRLAEKETENQKLIEGLRHYAD